jgi:hypothetical protein
MRRKLELKQSPRNLSVAIDLKTLVLKYTCPKSPIPLPNPHPRLRRPRTGRNMRLRIAQPADASTMVGLTENYPCNPLPFEAALLRVGSGYHYVDFAGDQCSTWSDSYTALVQGGSSPWSMCDRGYPPAVTPT